MLGFPPWPQPAEASHLDLVMGRKRGGDFRGVCMPGGEGGERTWLSSAWGRDTREGWAPGGSGGLGETAQALAAEGGGKVGESPWRPRQCGWPLAGQPAAHLGPGPHFPAWGLLERREGKWVRQPLPRDQVIST